MSRFGDARQAWLADRRRHLGWDLHQGLLERRFSFNVSQGGLGILPTDVLHQRFDFPAGSTGPGGKTASQRVAAERFHSVNVCVGQKLAQQRHDAVRVQ